MMKTQSQNLTATSLLPTDNSDVPVRIGVAATSGEIQQNAYRAVKRRCASMKGFKSFTNAAITIAEFELAHCIHNRKLSLRLGGPRRN